MKVIREDDIRGSYREVHCPQGGFTSLRYLLAADGMGFTLTKTTIPAGPPRRWHYTNHLEACFCVAGKGLLTELESGRYWSIAPGTVYAPDNHDPHTFEALESVTLVCVFNPPLFGAETHQKDGSYELGGRISRNPKKGVQL